MHRQIAGLAFCVVALAMSAVAQTTVTNGNATAGTIPTYAGSAPLGTPATTSVPGSAPPGWQSTTVPAAPVVPDRILYHFFFIHVVNLDKAADKMEAEGKKADYYRDLDQKGAGLTNDEGATVKQVAHDCIQLLEDQKATIKATIDARRALLPTPPKNLITRSEMAQNGAARDATLNEHLAQLKNLLGDESFAKLDAYVKNLIHPKIVDAPAKPPERAINMIVPLNIDGNGGAR
jgi:hypothetical protein